MRRWLLAVTVGWLATVPLRVAEPSEPARETPGPRWGHVLVWDEARREVLLFGGARERGEYLSDTWVWDGERWSRRDVVGPPARGFPAASYHPGRKTVVIHGGRAEGRRPHSDTWEWDGESWREIESETSFQADHHQMVHLPGGELLAFGGWTGEGVSDETWIFDDSWRRVAGEAPPGRASYGMAFDPRRGVAVLSGGLWIEGQYADVWEWSGAGWRPASGPYDNSSLDHHSLLWDPTRDQVLGFGGKNYRYQPLARTFVVRDGRHHELAREGPEPRHSTPLAWDGIHERVLLYGGKTYQDEEQVPLADFWAWDGEHWTKLAAD